MIRAIIIPKRKNTAARYNKGFLLLLLICFCAFIQIKAQKGNDYSDAKKDTFFYYHKTVYEVNELYYSAKNNQLLDDTTLQENNSVDSLDQHVFGYPPGKVNTTTTYVKGRIYLCKRRELVDFSKFDTLGFHEEWYNPYGLSINKDTYFIVTDSIDTNRDWIEIDYYPNNRLKEINMSYGKVGSDKNYYPNGNIASEGSYIDNQVNGISFSYFRNGLK